jgi:tripartite-type tricarboxylate transporter receptor subunit TctC
MLARRSEVGSKLQVLKESIMARPSRFLAALALSVAAASAPAQTDWPTKSVRIVVPFAPGGTADISARIIAEQLTNAFAQTFYVENRAGASGNIGAAEVARSKPDGYTLLLGNSSTLAINQFIYSKMPYNAERDFAPVSFLVRVPNVLVVHPSLGVRSLQELIERAKAKPGSISYGTSGAGTVLHLSAELLKTMAKIDLVHVPYKGSSPMLQDLVAGHLQMAIDNVPSALPHIRSGRLLALAVTPSKPVATLPNVPTMASVIPGYEAEAFFALVAPAGTPQPIITKLSAEIDKILHRPDVIERFMQLGAEPVGGTPAGLATFIASEIAKWREVVKTSGAKAD